ncbi:MAG: hypothetical protein EBR82_59525 [Caulobacteraceae bacterium]|nr:hypothetical protein [Caulobacteraceae bacterium]
MNRQYQIIYNNEPQGQFTIKCFRGESGGWHAQPKYRASWGGWSLEKSLEFANKDDAIKYAQSMILDYCELNKCQAKILKNTNWALV